MFRPIKKFINYIQKNASGSAIFGSSTSIAETDTDSGAEEIGIEANKIKITKGEAGPSAEGRSTEGIYTHKILNEQRGNEDMKRMDVKSANIVNCESATVTATATTGTTSDTMDSRPIANGIMACVDLEDDIELQIKSSVMIRPPLKPITMVENLTDEVDTDTDLERGEFGGGGGGILDRSDIDSQEDYDEYPNDRADIASLMSEDTAGGGEDTAEEEIITEEEDLEIISDQEHRFGDSEIIVINDADLNSSIASDAPSEDPLAIDECTQPSILAIKDTSSNTLDSSTNDEASTSTDLIWGNNIDTLKPNLEKDLNSHSNTIVPMSTPQRKLIESKEMNNNASSNIISSSITSTTSNTTSCSGSSTSATVPSTAHRDEHTEELRSDGSDSGLGSETSTLQTTLASLTDTSQLTAPSDNSATNTPTAANKLKTPTTLTSTNDYSNSVSSSSDNGNPSTAATLMADSIVTKSHEIIPIAVTAATAIGPPTAITVKPLRSNLKRRLEEDDALIETEAQHQTQTQLCTLDGNTQVKKFKRSINFDNVQVYYFPRQQGFGCVPSAGGCTLGMGARHIGFKTLTLAEHAAELRRAHRLQLQEINPRGFSSDDSEESEEDYLSEGSGSDLDAESNGFLQPVSPKQRRALLKAAGVRKIDTAEKIECRDIRNSREVCGCSCVEFCDPETCACSQAGIKCQVDRAMFPCGCTRDACGNIVGRVEFNPTRVRTHFIHTIMRLEMENRQQQNPPLCSTVSSYSLSAACATTSTTLVGGGALTNVLPSTPSYANSLPGSYYTMQTQSNYSSGYASPAYTSEPAANYYQQQSSSSIISSCSSTNTAAAGTTHFSAVSAATELQTSTQQNYQLDALDGGIFTATRDTCATPGYGDMLPAYGGSGVVSESTATVSAYHQNINYATVQQTQVSTYTAYQQTLSSGYLTAHAQQSAMPLAGLSATTTPPLTLPSSSSSALTPPTTYSSCAVPSLPPYGTATTTAVAAQYEDSSSYAALVDTTAPSCITMEDSGGDGNDVGSDGEENIVDDNCASIRIVTSIDNDTHGSNSNSVHAVTIDNNPNDAGGNILANDGSECGNDNGSSGDSGGDGDSSSFIQLSTPISSATRLSQINDLLEHNRRTTATLVAVSHTTTKCMSVNNNADIKPICNRIITTDCDYNDNSNSNSLDVQYKEVERAKEEDEEKEKKTVYITVEKEEIASKQHSTETSVQVTAANDEPPPPAAYDAKKTDADLKNTDTVVTTATLKATTVNNESNISAAMSKAENISDLKTTTASTVVGSTIATTTATETATPAVNDSANTTPIPVTSTANVVSD